MNKRKCTLYVPGFKASRVSAILFCKVSIWFASCLFISHWISNRVRHSLSNKKIILLFVTSSNRPLLTIEYICNTFILYVFIAFFQFFNCSFQFLARLLKYVPIRIEKFLKKNKTTSKYNYLYNHLLHFTFLGYLHPKTLEV